MKKPMAKLVLMVLAATLCSVASAQGPNTRHKAVSAKPFDEVIADLEFVIAEHNFRLTGRNEIGKAISKRNASSFPPATVIHFCNLEYAREFLEIASGYLLHMPCRVVVYERSEQVIIEARLLPQNDPQVQELSQRINRILKAIVAYAAE